MGDPGTSIHASLMRLRDCMNARDLEGLLECFHPKYESIHPCHPDRNSKGLAALSAGWSALFCSLSDFQASLERCAVDGETAWTEWCWHGTHSAGGTYESAGVMVFDMLAGQIVRAHIYSDVLPVDEPDWDNMLTDLLKDQPDEPGD
jgi:ketosteroid isomerase-like protein